MARVSLCTYELASGVCATRTILISLSMFILAPSRLVNPLCAEVADQVARVTPSSHSFHFLIIVVVSTTADKAIHSPSTLFRTYIPCPINCPATSNNSCSPTQFPLLCNTLLDDSHARVCSVGSLKAGARSLDTVNH